MVLQGNEEEGKRIEMQGRQLKRVGTAIAQEEIESDPNASLYIVERVRVVDVVDSAVSFYREFV
jgi:hypothetical protein